MAFTNQMLLCKRFLYSDKLSLGVLLVKALSGRLGKLAITDCGWLSAGSLTRIHCNIHTINFHIDIDIH